MATQLTVEDARESLTAHAAAKGAEIHAQYGPLLGWPELKRLLKDSCHVRYPCEVVFDASQLEPGEFAHPFPRGEHPSAGFDIHVHPAFMIQLDRVPALVLYQLVLVNYGDFASPDDAEAFGAAALGMDRDKYYELVCQAADDVG
jgi:hypothetical protein